MGVCTHRRNELRILPPTTLLGSNFLCKRVAFSFGPSLPRTAPIRNSWLRERRDGSGQSLSEPLNPKLSSCSASSDVPPLIRFPLQCFRFYFTCFLMIADFSLRATISLKRSKSVRAARFAFATSFLHHVVCSHRATIFSVAQAFFRVFSRAFRGIFTFKSVRDTRFRGMTCCKTPESGPSTNI